MRVEQQQQWRRISRDGSKSCCGQSPLAPPSPYFSLLYIYLYCSNTITSSSFSFSFSFCRRRRAVAAIIIFRGNLGRLIDRPARKPAVVRFSHGRLYIKMAGSLLLLRVPSVPTATHHEPDSNEIRKENCFFLLERKKVRRESALARSSFYHNNKKGLRHLFSLSVGGPWTGRERGKQAARCSGVCNCRTDRVDCSLGRSTNFIRHVIDDKVHCLLSSLTFLIFFSSPDSEPQKQQEHEEEKGNRLDGEERRAMHEEKEYEKRERERERKSTLWKEGGREGLPAPGQAGSTRTHGQRRGGDGAGYKRERERGENRSGPPIKYAGP